MGWLGSLKPSFDMHYISTVEFCFSPWLPLLASGTLLFPLRALEAPLIALVVEKDLVDGLRWLWTGPLWMDMQSISLRGLTVSLMDGDSSGLG
jgi:hypothetical protein